MRPTSLCLLSLYLKMAIYVVTHAKENMPLKTYVIQSIFITHWNMPPKILLRTKTFIVIEFEIPKGISLSKVRKVIGKYKLNLSKTLPSDKRIYGTGRRRHSQRGASYIEERAIVQPIEIGSSPSRSRPRPTWVPSSDDFYTDNESEVNSREPTEDPR